MKKTELIQASANNLVAPVSLANITPSQKAIVRIHSERIVTASSRLEMKQREALKIKERLNASEDARRLKALKQEIKQLKHLHKDSVNVYNGALEMALADVDGANLSEKIENIKMLEGA